MSEGIFKHKMAQKRIDKLEKARIKCELTAITEDIRLLGYPEMRDSTGRERQGTPPHIRHGTQNRGLKNNLIQKLWIQTIWTSGGTDFRENTRQAIGRRWDSRKNWTCHPVRRTTGIPCLEVRNGKKTGTRNARCSMKSRADWAVSAS